MLSDLAKEGLTLVRGPAILAGDRPLDGLTKLPGDARIVATISPGSRYDFAERSWILPTASGARDILLLCPIERLCLAMMISAFRAGMRRIVWPAAGGWEKASLLRLMIRQALGKLSHELYRRLLGLTQSRWRQGRWRRLQRLVRSTAQRGAVQAVAQAERCRNDSPRSGDILVVTPTLGTGGAERLTVNLALRLAEHLSGLRLFSQSLDERRGHDFFLAELEAKGLPCLSGETLMGTGAVALSPDQLALLAKFPASLRQDVRLYMAAFERYRPEVVLASQDLTNIAAGLAAVMTGVPRIVLSTVSMSPVHFHHYLPVMDGVYALLAARPEVTLINNSAMGAADYERWLELEPGRITVLRNGLADIRRSCPPEAGTELRTRLGIPQNAPLIGAVQRMAPVKDPVLWLDVARKVQDVRPETYFLLAGDGPELANMQTQASRLGLNAVFPGAMENPVPALDAIDLFLLTSWNEGLPNGVVEAQIMGRPVVAAKVGGVPEALADGVTGRLVDSRAPEDYAAAILALLADPPEAETCRSFALERFGLERMIEENLTLLGYKKP